MTKGVRMPRNAEAVASASRAAGASASGEVGRRGLLFGWTHAKILFGVTVAIAALTVTFAASASATSYGVLSLGVHGADNGAGCGECRGSGDVNAVTGLSGVKAISAYGNSLALLNNGSVLTWGEGILGNGTFESFSPVGVCASGNQKECPGGPYLTEATAISDGFEVDLALLSDGNVMAWGRNITGAVGDGTFNGPSKCGEGNIPCSRTPVPVCASGKEEPCPSGPYLNEVTAVASGSTFALALLKNGTVVAWGSNREGELGDGLTEFSDVPVAVSGLSEVTAISAGGFHAMALLKNGTVKTWGANFDGQLGNGTTTKSRVPVTVSGLSEVSAISAGYEHSMALLKNGTVKTWGSNQNGELGNGTTTNSDVPVTASGLSEVSAISGSGRFSLALLNTGKVDAWGENGDFVLGIEEEIFPGVTTPKAVPQLSSIAGISAGFSDSLAYGTFPTVTGLTPTKGLSETSVTIAGVNLGGATAVRFGSTAATSFTVNSETSITAVAPPGAGTVHVSVTTPTGVSFPSSAYQFTYPVASPTVVTGAASAITSTSATMSATVNPNDGEVSECRLEYGTTLSYGSSAACTPAPGSGESPVAVSASVTGLSASTTYHFGISATNSGGTSEGSDEMFKTVSATAPTVSNVNPTSGATAGGTSVSITGTNFSGATAVKFGSTSATSFTVKTATTITAVSPAEAAGTVDVTVTTSGGTSAISSKDHFKFLPTVTGLSPNTGSKAGGTRVTVSGTGFAPGSTATVFKFGTTKGTSVNCTSTTECTVVAPAHAVGKVDVKATVNKASSAKNAPADQFTYS